MNITEPSFGESEIEALRVCLNSKWVTQGPMTDRFERLLAERHRVKHAIACTSCTAALHLATMALGLGPGDEVIVPAFTWVTSAHAAEYVGARVVFADVRADSYNLDPAALEAMIGPRTKAVMAVHLFGLAAEMGQILKIARRHGLLVIEDAACAIGTTYGGRPVGSISDVGCFSFHPRKVITTGEGGLVTTDRDDIAAVVRSLRNHGSTGAPSAALEAHGPWTMATFDRLGFNLRLSDIQAAVGVAQIGKLDALLGERLSLAERYTKLLGGLSEIALPHPTNNATGHTYQSYVIRLLEGGRSRRNAVMANLAKHDIQTRPGTHAVHRLGYYREKYGIRAEEFPVAAASEDTTITLPLFPGLTAAGQQRVAEVLAEALAKKA